MSEHNQCRAVTQGHLDKIAALEARVKESEHLHAKAIEGIKDEWERAEAAEAQAAQMREALEYVSDAFSGEGSLWDWRGIPDFHDYMATALSSTPSTSLDRWGAREKKYQAWLEDYSNVFNIHARHHPSCKQGIPCECGLSQELARLRWPCPANYEALDADKGEK